VVEVASSAPEIAVASSAPAVAVASSAPPPPPPAQQPLPGSIMNLVNGGHWDSAAKALVAYRDQNPKDPRAAFMLGHVWMSRTYWTEGFKQYQQAFDLDPQQKTDPIYIGDLVKALESPSWYGKAEYQLRAVGKAAVPFLQDAVKNNPAASIIHRRAAEVLQQM
jgi:hypothetical protein